jgi:ABC-2 type transport system permease protein
VSARRLGALARRIAQGFRRDERTLGLMFVVPILITALLGWVIRGGTAPSLDVVVTGNDVVANLLRSAAGTQPNGPAITVETAPDAAAAREQVKNGDADVALIISGQQPGAAHITIVTEGTDPASDGSRIGLLQALITAAFSNASPAGAIAAPEVSHETIYLSPDADALDVLAPVFLGYFAYFFVFILTGISFLRERIGGTLERLLATPVTRGEIVVGYSLGFGIFATIQVIVLIVFALMAIDVPALGPIPAFTIGLGVATAGSPILLFGLALLLALGAVNLGIFLSTFARTELQVIQFIPIVIVPQGLLGGIFWPVERLPDILQPVARVLPVTYAVDGLRAVMLRGADLASSTVQLDLLVLAGVAVFFIALATRTISREVA